MATIKGFWRDSRTREIYAIESTTFGKIVGAVGPLDKENLKDLNSYQYKPAIVDWIEMAIAQKRLRRINPT